MAIISGKGTNFDRKQCDKQVHCEKRHHWTVANITGGTTDVVTVMDSVCYIIDQDIKQIIFNLFQCGPKQPAIKLIRTQKQEVKAIVIVWYLQ